MDAWNFCRKVLSRGGAISSDFADRPYEQYAARLDAAAGVAAGELEAEVARLRDRIAELEATRDRLGAVARHAADALVRLRAALEKVRDKWVMADEPCNARDAILGVIDAALKGEG